MRMLIALADEDGGHDPAQDLATNKLLDRRDPRRDPAPVRATGRRARPDREARHRHESRRPVPPLQRRPRPAAPTSRCPHRATLRALALSELSRAGGAVDIMATRPPRPEVTLVVRADEPDAPTTTVTGARLQDGTTRTLCCDPDLYAVVVDSLGVPLDWAATCAWPPPPNAGLSPPATAAAASPAAMRPSPGPTTTTSTTTGSAAPPRSRTWWPSAGGTMALPTATDGPWASRLMAGPVADAHRAHVLGSAPRPPTNRPRSAVEALDRLIPPLDIRDGHGCGLDGTAANPCCDAALLEREPLATGAGATPVVAPAPVGSCSYVGVIRES